VASLGRTDGKLLLSRGPQISLSSAPTDKGDHSTPCLAISKNDSYALFSHGSKIPLYNLVKAKELLAVWDIHDEMHKAQAAPGQLRHFTPSVVIYRPADNNLVAIGFQSGVIRVMNVNKSCVELRHEHKGPVCSLEFTDNHYLVSSASDGCVHFYPIPPPPKVEDQTYKELSFTSFQVSQNSVRTTIQFAPGSGFGTLLVVMPHSISIYACQYNNNTVQMTQKFSKTSKDEIVMANFSHDAKYVVCAFSTKIEILRPDNLTTLATMFDTDLSRSLEYPVTSFSAIAVPKTTFKTSTPGRYEFCAGTDGGRVFYVEISE